MTLMVQTRLKTPVPVTEVAINALRKNLCGTLCLPGDPGYHVSRTIWNAMIDRRPALVVQAVGAVDVVQTVNFAREYGALLAVRGGGHNIAGNAVCEGGIMLDLSGMRSVRVDPVYLRAHVEGGATLGDADNATQAFGLAIPLGIATETGVAGLTLGGGHGWTSRKLGLASDNLTSVEIVTADGLLRRADADQNADLFWAVRGGGGNFGVVTSFEFALHEIGPEVVAGIIVHPIADAPTLWKACRDLLASASDDLTGAINLRRAPPVPFIPAGWHNKGVAIIVICHCGSIADGMDAVTPFKALGNPICDFVAPRPFLQWQAAFDPLVQSGFRNYWKSQDLMTPSQEACRVMVDAVAKMPSDDCFILTAQVGGQIDRLAADATAYSRRAIQFVVSIHARWSNMLLDEACIAWARELSDDLAPCAVGTVYVNYMTEEETGRVRGAYGAHYDRLTEIKRRYDPENLFSMNQNIRV
jgi:FAD/FMN-containing dehydrogenase